MSFFRLPFFLCFVSFLGRQKRNEGYPEYETRLQDGTSIPHTTPLRHSRTFHNNPYQPQQTLSAISPSQNPPKRRSPTHAQAPLFWRKKLQQSNRLTKPECSTKQIVAGIAKKSVPRHRAAAPTARALFGRRSNLPKTAFSFVTFLLAEQKKSKVTPGTQHEKKHGSSNTSQTYKDLQQPSKFSSRSPCSGTSFLA